MFKLELVFLIAIILKCLNADDSKEREDLPLADLIQADTIINTKDNVVVLLTEEWCDSCVRFEPSLAAIASRIKKEYPGVEFIKVDLKNNQEAWKFYNAMSLPHVVFTNKGTPISYSGEVEERELEKWILHTLRVQPIELVPAEHLRYRLKRSSMRFIFVGERDTFEFDEIEALARMTKERIFFTNNSKLIGNLIAAHNKSSSRLQLHNTFLKLNVKTGKAVIFRNDSLNHPFEANNLRIFMSTSSLAYPEAYSAKLLSELFGNNIPILILFQKEFSSKRITDWLKDREEEIRSRLAVMKVSNSEDEKQSILYRYCNVHHSNQDFALCIVLSYPRMKRYVFQDPVNEQNVGHFIDSFFKGRLQEYLAVETIIEPSTRGVLNLNTKSLDELMTNSPDTDKIIFLYSDRGETSGPLIDSFQEIAQLYKSKCLFAKLNMDRNEIPDLDDVKVPAMVALKGYGDLTASTYEGTWAKEDMKKFVWERIQVTAAARKKDIPTYAHQAGRNDGKKQETPIQEQNIDL